MGKRKHDRTAEIVAASAAVAAGGAIAARKLVRDRLAERRQRERARRYRFGPNEELVEGIDRVGRGQLDLAIDLLEGREGSDREAAIHEARKTLKRSRALLRLGRDAIEDDVYRRENAILRDAGRELSGARDAQVLLETLDGLGDGGFRRLREALARRAADARNAEPPAHVTGALKAVRTRVPAWATRQNGGPSSTAPGLERIYRRGRRAYRAARAHPETEQLHELRKRAKDLWHAAQLLRAAQPKRMKKLARRAHRLSDRLGDDHDLAVLLEQARAGPELLDPGELELLDALIDRRRATLQSEALERASRLYSRGPRKLVRRLALS
jgi:CHAD domain-containing protein